MPDEREKLNRIEDVKSRLFSKSYKTQIEHRDIFKQMPASDVPDAWTKTTPESSERKFFMKTSWFKKFFFFSIAFFILALVYAGYTFFIKGNIVSSNNIDISVLGNTFTAGGEELPLQINITNKNNAALELVDLIMEYPKSSASGLSDGTERVRQTLGTIPAGAVRSENVKLTLFGQQGTVRDVKISIQYRLEGSVSIFLKEKLYQVTINSTPVDISVTAPSEVSPNQDIALGVKVTLNANKVAPAMLLRVDYPAGFQFTSAVPAPSSGNNIWSLGDLAPGAVKSISIVGKMIDVFDGEQKTFRLSSGSASAGDKSLIDVVFSSVDQTLQIKKPFIEARVFINGVYQREYATDTKTKIQGEVRWVNNLDTKINDLTIRAKISGNGFNRKTVIASDGLYSSSDATITWDKNYKSNFLSVNPGEYGSVNFTIDPLPLFSAGSGLITDPTINIEVSISGAQALEGNSVQQLNNSEVKIVRLISDATLASKLLYYSGGFTNTGAVPPVAEKETTYTGVWTLSNTANNVSKVKVTSTLPPWVRFIGNPNPATEDVSYNASTREVVWNAGSLPRGTGITGGTKQVSFQIGFTPSLSQVGSIPILMNDAILTGYDDFANVPIRATKASLTSDLANDPAFPISGGKVVE